ncbi:hypothetical protein [Sorangium sp. So ce117]|uniref:hypothetical protein n=1 Tax=Sorangium sp. So ce117 TaxID=3133277 RepID=UPI003F5EC5C9
MDGTAVKAWAQIREIERELGRLTLSIEPADAAVRIDGRPLEGDLLGGTRGRLVAGTLPAGPGRPPPAARFEVLLDAGRHEIELSRPGYLGRRVAWSAAKSANETLSLSLTPAPRSAGERALLYTGASLVSVGALGIVGGTVSGAWAWVKKNAANDGHCSWQDKVRSCDATGLKADQDARTLSHVATATFFPGLALAAGGTVLLLFARGGPTHSAGPSSRTHLSAAVGQNGAQLSLEHVW